MELQFSIRPGINPLDRGEIEDAVVDALGGNAECLGGGGMVDGSESDFTIEITGVAPEVVLERCRDLFSIISFSAPTLVTLAIEDESYTLTTAIDAD